MTDKKYHKKFYLKVLTSKEGASMIRDSNCVLRHEKGHLYERQRYGEIKTSTNAADDHGQSQYNLITVNSVQI